MYVLLYICTVLCMYYYMYVMLYVCTVLCMYCLYVYMFCFMYCYMYCLCTVLCIVICMYCYMYVMLYVCTVIWDLVGLYIPGQIGVHPPVLTLIVNCTKGSSDCTHIVFFLFVLSSYSVSHIGLESSICHMIASDDLRCPLKIVSDIKPIYDYTYIIYNLHVKTS